MICCASFPQFLRQLIHEVLMQYSFNGFMVSVQCAPAIRV
jgi:hypothetical protein